jgi:TRAP transporter TAXI family solute receptor
MMTTPRTLALLLSLAAAVFSLPAAAQSTDLTWSGGQPTGGWFQQAEGFARLVAGKNPALQIKPVTGAAYGNMTRLQKGETTLAWSFPSIITAAYTGKEPYTAPESDLRIVMTGLGFVASQFCVAEDSPIRSIRQIFEQKLPLRIGSPRPGGSDEWELRKIFEFYKTTYADLPGRGGKLVFGSFEELVTQYGAGGIDAFILNNAVPADDVERASRVRKTRILPMDDDLMAWLATFGMVRTQIAKGSYPLLVNNDAPIATAAMANTIVTSAKVPEAVVYDFTKIVLGNLAAVRALHPAFADFDPAVGQSMPVVPMHPGAARAFREAGFSR